MNARCPPPEHPNMLGSYDCFMNNGLIFVIILIAIVIIGGILGGPIAAIILAALAVAYGGLYWIYHLMNKHLH